MNSNMMIKSILAAGAFAMALSACNKNDDGSTEAKVRNSNGAGAGTLADENVLAGGKGFGQADLSKPQALDISKMPLAQQKHYQITAQDVVNLRKMNKTAHKIFQEAWKKVWQSEMADVRSVFSLTEDAFKNTFADNGLPLVEQNISVANGKNQAKGATVLQPRIRNQSNAQVNGQNQTTAVICKKPMVYEMKISKATNIEGVLVPESYDLMLTSCKEGISNKFTMAQIFKGQGAQGQSGYKVIYNKSNLAAYLGTGIQFFSQEQATCELYPNADGKLQQLDCKGIGQNRTNDNFIQFSTFSFSRTNDVQLKGEGIKYEVGQLGAKEILRVKLEDKPNVNLMSIDEEQIKPAVIEVEAEITAETTTTTTTMTTTSTVTTTTLLNFNEGQDQVEDGQDPMGESVMEASPEELERRMATGNKPLSGDMPVHRQKELYKDVGQDRGR